MSLELVIAGLALFITVIINIVAVSFFAGILKSNQDHQKEMLQLLKEDFQSHFTRLEQKQDKHNNLIERMASAENSIKSAHHRINDIKGIVKF